MKQLLILLLSSICIAIHGQESFDSLILISQSEVYFDSNEAHISEAEAAKIDLLVKQAEAFDSTAFSVIAHTDNVGGDEFNIELSLRRADAVKQYLADSNVSQAAISSEYYGEGRPKAENDTKRGRSQNRRAIIRTYQHKQLQWLRGRIIDEDSGMGVAATIKLHSKTYQGEALSDMTGTFQIAAPKDEVVGIDVRSRGYIIASKMLKVKRGLKIEIEMPAIKEGKSFDLKRLFFIGNKDSLLEKSKSVLPNLLYTMTENPEVCIEIKGHINLPYAPKVKVDTWDMHLSIARAKRLHDYLLNQKVDSSRILYQGYGNWNMIHPKATSPADMAKNRRVEIEFINCDTARVRPDALLSDLYEFKTGNRPSKYKND